MNNKDRVRHNSYIGSLIIAESQYMGDLLLVGMSYKAGNTDGDAPGFALLRVYRKIHNVNNMSSEQNDENVIEAEREAKNVE